MQPFFTVQRIWDLVTDDSSDWNRQIYNNFEQYCKDLYDNGFFYCASIIVLGLELDEQNNFTAEEVQHMIEILRTYSKNIPIATHWISWPEGPATSTGDYSWNNGDIIFAQVKPEAQNDILIGSIDAAKKAVPNGLVYMFELDRKENNDKCLIALANGAFGVGNW